MSSELYPVTIIRTRYVGEYEGVTWAAFNSHQIPDAAQGSDVPCSIWWGKNKHLVGVGSNPIAAYQDLETKSKDFDKEHFSVQYVELEDHESENWIYYYINSAGEACKKTFYQLLDAYKISIMFSGTEGVPDHIRVPVDFPMISEGMSYSDLSEDARQELINKFQVWRKQNPVQIPSDQPTFP